MILYVVPITGLKVRTDDGRRAQVPSWSSRLICATLKRPPPVTGEPEVQVEGVGNIDPVVSVEGLERVPARPPPEGWAMITPVPVTNRSELMMPSSLWRKN